MERVNFQGIEIDRCTNCKGIWFDMREHEHLKKIRGSEAIDVGSPKTGAVHNRKGDVKCPRCGTKMIPMVDARQPHIWYESCPVCYGIFFDAGEFSDWKEETIMDFFRDLLASPRKYWE